MDSSPMSAAQKVFLLPELVELILLKASPRSIVMMQRVCSTANGCSKLPSVQARLGVISQYEDGERATPEFNTAVLGESRWPFRSHVFGGDWGLTYDLRYEASLDEYFLYISAHADPAVFPDSVVLSDADVRQRAQSCMPMLIVDPPVHTVLEVWLGNTVQVCSIANQNINDPLLDTFGHLDNILWMAERTYFPRRVLRRSTRVQEREDRRRAHARRNNAR